MEKNKIKVIDLFCGAGGFSLGFLKQNYNIELAIDFDIYCERVYKLNLPNINFVRKNLKKIDKNFFKNYTPDIVIGGPPCQGFSTIGSRVSSCLEKRKKKDLRNNLIFSFIDHINFLKPKIFLMENVLGILTKDKGSILKQLKKRINAIGYKYEIFILDAVNYGVPQFRKRVFILGSRDKSINLEEPEITHQKNLSKNKFIAINSFIDDLSKIEEDALINHVPLKHRPKNIKRYKLIPEGGRLPENKLSKDLFRKNFGNTFKRLHRNKPALTMVPGHNAFPIHPWLNRSLTVREAARIQTYPDSYIFVGPRHEQCMQVGNSVPVKLSEIWAKHIKKILDSKLESTNEKAA